MKKVILATLVALFALSGNAFAIIFTDIDGTNSGEWASGLTLTANDPNEGGIPDDYDFERIAMIQKNEGAVDDGMYVLVDLWGTPNFTSLDAIPPVDPVFYQLGIDVNMDGDFFDAVDRNFSYTLANGLQVYDGNSNFLGGGTVVKSSVVEWYVPESIMGTPLSKFQISALLDSGASQQSDDFLPDSAFAQSVPEPASMALLGFGLLGVIGAGFKKRFTA